MVMNKIIFGKEGLFNADDLEEDIKRNFSGIIKDRCKIIPQNDKYLALDFGSVLGPISYTIDDGELRMGFFYHQWKEFSEKCLTL